MAGYSGHWSNGGYTGPNQAGVYAAAFASDELSDGGIEQATRRRTAIFDQMFANSQRMRSLGDALYREYDDAGRPASIEGLPSFAAYTRAERLHASLGSRAASRTRSRTARELIAAGERLLRRIRGQSAAA